MAALMSGPPPPLDGQPVEVRLGHYEVREPRAPKGPTGLWAALTEGMTPTADTECEPAHEAVELSSAAHLRYLARLAPSETEPTAEVVDLAAFRARRSA